MKKYSGKINTVGNGIVNLQNGATTYSVIQIEDNFLQNITSSGMISSYLTPGYNADLYVKSSFSKKDIIAIKREDGIIIKPKPFTVFMKMLLEILLVPFAVVISAGLTFSIFNYFFPKQEMVLYLTAGLFGICLLVVWYQSISYFIKCLKIK